MWILTLFKCCVVALSFGTFVTPRTHLRDFGLQETESEILGQDIDCSNLNDCEASKGRIGFICSNNGRTYKNLCSFMTAFCTESDIKFKHHGECTASEKCLGSRRVSLKKSKMKPGVYIPTCNADGTFTPVQCHKDTKFCWCSTPAGASIPDTAVDNENPRCDNLTGPPSAKDAKSQRSGRKGGCEGARKKLFNRNILENMLHEFRKNNKNTLVTDDQLLTAALNWKFLQLDVQPDGVLSRSEYRGIQKLIKGNISPKKCAKKFPKLCDKNSDKKISLHEWLNCFGDEIGIITIVRSDKKHRKTHEHKSRKGGNKHPRKPKPDCALDNKQANDISNYSNHTVYVPKCDSKGRYLPIQCYGSHGKNLWYCFCVNVVTGKMIPNTSVQNVQPDCPLIARPWPRCLGQNTESIFLKNLLGHFYNIARNINSWEYHSEKFTGKRVLEIIFRKLDKNKNGQLEAKEKKKLKGLLKKQKKIWKCGRKIHKVCDINYDGKIVLLEFLTCVLPRNSTQIAGSVEKEKKINRKSKGINGFIEIITPE